MVVDHRGEVASELVEPEAGAAVVAAPHRQRDRALAGLQLAQLDRADVDWAVEQLVDVAGAVRPGRAARLQRGDDRPVAPGRRLDSHLAGRVARLLGKQVQRGAVQVRVRAVHVVGADRELVAVDAVADDDLADVASSLEQPLALGHLAQRERLVGAGRLRLEVSHVARVVADEVRAGTPRRHLEPDRRPVMPAQAELDLDHMALGTRDGHAVAKRRDAHGGTVRHQGGIRLAPVGPCHRQLKNTYRSARVHSISSRSQ